MVVDISQSGLLENTLNEVNPTRIRKIKLNAQKLLETRNSVDEFGGYDFMLQQREESH